MRRVLCLASVAVLGLVLAGCAGANAFQRVDLSRDLRPEDVARYEKEWAAVKDQGGGAVLEHTNGWPLGLLAYWDRGTVMRTGTDPVEYHVRRTSGYGPLSLLYVTETHSTYNAQGKLLGKMEMGSILFGHLAMYHTGDVLLNDGRWQHTYSSHWLMFLNIHKMDGHSATSIITGPNILGVESHGACH